MLFFFCNDTAPTEIYTLSLHDALPIWISAVFSQTKEKCGPSEPVYFLFKGTIRQARASGVRSEEHTSELQSLTNLVCRLLLEKKKKNENQVNHIAKKYNQAPKHKQQRK